MAFGLQNLGVIDQRGTPAIWQSQLIDFPINNIKGRLLLDLTNIVLYVDLANSSNGGMSSRAVIASGLIGDGNGTTIESLGSGDYSVDFGGELTKNTSLVFQNNSLDFVVSNAKPFTINGRKVFPIEEILNDVVVPNVRLRFRIDNNLEYEIQARKL